MAQSSTMTLDEWSMHLLILKVLYCTMFFSCSMANMLCTYFVVSYVKSKPLGMQTFLDQIITDLCFSFALCTNYALWFLIFGVLFVYVSPINHHVALVISFNCELFWMIFLMEGLIFVFVKYLSIYQHAGLEALLLSYSDEELLKSMRQVTFLVALCFEVMDHGFITDPTKFCIYEVLTYGRMTENVEWGKIHQILSSLIIASSMILLGKIEVDKHFFNKFTNVSLTGDTSLESTTQFQVKDLISTRIGIILFCLASVLMVYVNQRVGPLLQLLFACITTFCFFVAIPLLYILTNENVRKHSAKQLKAFREMICSLFMK